MAALLPTRLGLLLLVCGCGPSAPTPTAPSPSPSAFARAPIARPTSAREARSATARELLAKLDGGVRATVPLLARMCRVAIGAHDVPDSPELHGQVEVGCTCCPPFDDCRPEPGGAVEVVVEPRLYTLRHHHQGSFTRSGGKQLAATFWGCESGADNRGGTVVFEERAGVLEVAAYRSGVNPNACEVLPGTARPDQLVCQWSDGQGGLASTRVVRVDLTQEIDDAGALEELVSLPMDGICTLDVGMPFADSQLLSFHLSDIDGDGDHDVVLDLAHRGGVVAQAHLDRCAAAPEPPFLPDTLPSPQSFRLEFLQTPAKFSATPATKQRLEALYGARDRFWQQLNGP